MPTLETALPDGFTGTVWLWRCMWVIWIDSCRCICRV